MRKLKMKLADDNQYVFTTLTRRQCGAIQKEQKERASFQELQALSTKQEEEGLSDEEEERALELQELEEQPVYDIIRMSMQKNHPEYALLDEEDPEKGEENARHNAEATDRLLDLIDMRDIQILSGFAISGTVDLEDTQDQTLTDIVLS